MNAVSVMAAARHAATCAVYLTATGRPALAVSVSRSELRKSMSAEYAMGRAHWVRAFTPWCDRHAQAAAHELPD